MAAPHTGPRAPLGVNEDERKLVDLIERLDTEGLSAGEIARRLEAEGCVGRSGRPMAQTSVGRIVARLRRVREAEERVERFVVTLNAGTLTPADLDELPIGELLAGLDEDVLATRLRALGTMLAGLGEDARDEVASRLGRELVGAFGVEGGLALVQTLMVNMAIALMERGASP